MLSARTYVMPVRIIYNIHAFTNKANEVGFSLPEHLGVGMILPD